MYGEGSKICDVILIGGSKKCDVFYERPLMLSAQITKSVSGDFQNTKSIIYLKTKLRDQIHIHLKYDIYTFLVYN